MDEGKLDPNETLELISSDFDINNMLNIMRGLYEKITETGGGILFVDARMMVEGFHQIDDYLSAGGALPKDWERTKK